MNSMIPKTVGYLRRTWRRTRQNRRIRAMARQVFFLSPRARHAPLVFFNASTRLSGLSLNAGFSLLAAWSLRLGGVPVVHFVCRSGLSRCVLGTQRGKPEQPPPCAECLNQSRTNVAFSQAKWFDLHADEPLDALLGTLNLEQLEEFTHHEMPLGKLVLPSLRWILRRHHLPDDEDTRFLCRQYIRSAWSLAQQFTAVLEEVKPQAVVVFNGMFYPEASARWVAMQKGVRVISHEVGLQPVSAYFTSGEATAYPIDIPAEFEMSPAQNQRLEQYLEQRFQRNFSMAGIRFWPEMVRPDPVFWEKAAGFKQIVPIFTNVVFDTSQGHANVVFPHMFAWLDLVLKIIRTHPETLFIIRAHPDECRPGKESLESVADWVRLNQIVEGPQALANVRFIDAGEYFSSYELIQKSKFVMVYNSTIGLEASILGVPVLCGGKARFTQLPTVFFPASPDEYRQCSEEFLTLEQIDVPPEFQINARRFLYYQLFRTSLPFESFLEDDGIWKGYVRLKPFRWDSLLAENSPALKTIADGLLNSTSFLLPE
jgi:hypothetical protein